MATLNVCVINKGAQAQAVGAAVIAQVYLFNEQNLTLGALTTAGFNTMMADNSLEIIERLLWNGSLATALGLIQSSTVLPNYFSADQIAAIESIINTSGLV